MTQIVFSNIKMVIGLGNPGKEFEKTYHNVGFLALGLIRKTLHAGPFRPSPRGRFAYLTSHDRVFVEPKTFMNDSGRAVRAAMAHFKVNPGEILVIHDDADISLGSYKFAFGRSAAGHRGVASIIEALGTKSFWRLRVGVRRDRGQAGTFVLSAMSPGDREEIYSAVRGAIEKLTENVRP